MANTGGNNKKMLKMWLLVICFVGLMAIWAANSSSPTGNQLAPSAGSSQPASGPTSPEPHASVLTTYDWVYNQSESEMGLGSVNTATVQSSNTVSFGFPYQGPQHATLTIRTHPQYGKDVFFSIQRGQLLIRSYNNDVIILRFDDDKPIRIHAVEPKDHDSTTIFLQGYSGLVERMKKAKLLRVQVPVYQEGEPVFEFNVAGLNWPMKQ